MSVALVCVLVGEVRGFGPVKSLQKSFGSEFVSSENAQLPHSHQVERDRVPQAHGADLGQAADSELLQPAVAAFGVGEFGDRRAALQDRFRVLRLHPLAEREHLVGVVSASRVRVAAPLENAWPLR